MRISIAIAEVKQLEQGNKCFMLLAMLTDTSMSLSCIDESLVPKSKQQFTSNDEDEASQDRLSLPNSSPYAEDTTDSTTMRFLASVDNY